MALSNIRQYFKHNIMWLYRGTLYRDFRFNGHDFRLFELEKLVVTGFLLALEVQHLCFAIKILALSHSYCIHIYQSICVTNNELY